MSVLQDSSAEILGRRKRLSETGSPVTACGLRLMRGGRMTKWKGHVASCAPHVPQLATGTTKAWAVAFLPAALVIALATGQAGAASRFFDQNGTTAGRGVSDPVNGGNWDTTSNFWSPNGDGLSGPYTTWNNGALDDAFFGGTAGTVTLQTGITAHNLTFETVGYTLNGNTLTLGGAAPTITMGSGVSATINSVIAGTAGLTKSGAGTLILGGANTFSGGVIVNGGALNINGDAALGNPGNGITMANGTLLQSTGALNSSRVVTLSSGSVTIAGAGAGSARFTGAGGLNVAGGVTLNNNGNDYTGRTSTTNGGTISFTSIADLGVASALGAPTTVANGTVTISAFQGGGGQANYTGAGSSSNRNWLLQSDGLGGAVIANAGTGTLTLTGDIAATSGGAGTGFQAMTADLVLTGVISSANTQQFAFLGNSPSRSITLGAANTFAGLATIGNVTVRASSLADTGTASSLGTGANGGISITNLGNLVYTGAGASSNRALALSGSVGLGNDGTGALTLSGAATFSGTGNTLTLGGSFAGVNTMSGVISGAANLVMNGGSADVWQLTAANSMTGNTTVNGGTLRLGNAQALGLAPQALTVNGGSLDLNGNGTAFTSLTGTGGSVALNGGANLTVNGTTSTTYAGSLTGTGGLVKNGTSTLTLTGQSTYTGATTVQGGTLKLDFSPAGGVTSDMVSASSTLNMSGGTLNVTGAANEADTQTFNGTNITAGNNTISATSGVGGSATVNLGAITHTGGLVNFTLPTSGNITTTSSTLGGWATVNGTDYAQVVGGNIAAFTAYANKDNAATWVNGDVVSDTAGAANSPYFGTVTGSVQLGGLKYTAAADSTVTIGAGNTLGIDGTIIVASSVGPRNLFITGGSLTGPAGGGTLGVLNNSSANYRIQSTIVDNGGAVGFTAAGTGLVTLTGANTYTGATTLSGGTLVINSVANAGAASAIGAATANPANLVLENGTLEYNGATASTDRGFTLVNGGPSRTIQVDGSANLTFGGLVTSPDDAGLTKSGTGTLTLANGANNYVGVTSITGGVLSISTLANGGVASGIGASSSNPANLLLSGGGTLQYTGGTASSDRGFTLAGGNGAIDVSNAATTLSMSGTAMGAGTLNKNGAGTLVLSGTNSYSGGTIVNAGTLRAGSAQAFGHPSAVMTVNTGGTLDINGVAGVVVGALAGAGNVALGSATLTMGNNNGTFSGAISGTGGLLRNGLGTQTLSGCNSTYTGATTINGGSLSVDCLANGGQASAIGASSSASANLSIHGTLAYTGGSVSTDRGFTAGNAAINVTNAATVLEFTGQATGAQGPGSGSVTKQGPGTLVLSNGSNNFANVAVGAGTMRAGAAEAFGTGNLDVTAGATLDLNGFSQTNTGLSGAGAVTLGSATLTMNSNGGPFSGAISGSGGLLKTAGTQTLTGCSSSYTGSTVITGGVLAVNCLANGGVNSAIGASSNAASNLVLNGGTLQYVGAGGSTDRLFTLGPSATSALDASGTGAIAFTNTGGIAFSTPNTAQTVTLTGANTGNNSLAALLADNGTGKTSLTKSGAGTWILSNPASTYTGVTTISGGVLGVSKLSNGLQASSLGASSSAASNLVIGNGATLRYTGAGDNTDRLFTLAAGSTSIESSGSGAVNFTNTGAVTYSGSGPRTIGLGGTNTGLNTMGGQITDGSGGATTLGKSGPGTWVLTGNNTFTGNTVINGGNLMIGNGGTSGNAGAGNVIIADATSTLSFNRSDTFNFTGTIMPDSGAGKGTIAQIGTGTTVLTAAGNVVNATRVDAGTLQVNGLTTATVAMNGTGTLTVNGTVGAAAGAASTFTGDAGASTININNGGTLRANGDLGAGNDTVNVSGTLATGAAVLNLGAGNDTLVLNDTAVFTGAGVDAGTGGESGVGDTLQVTTTAGRSLDGANVSNFETLAKQGAGTLTLTGNHSYSAGTTISAGTLQIGNGAVAGALATPSVVNNGTLAFNLNNTYAFDGAISGTGSVNKLGTGVTTLTGNNSYGGATNVNAGTLLINGNQSGATGPTAVTSGATLGGTGTIGGSVTVADGATLSPGGVGNAPGTLSINGNLALGNSNLNVNFGQANVVGGALNDLINVGGNLTLDGTLNVTQSPGGNFGPGTYRIISYNGSLTDNGLNVTDPNYFVQTSVANQVNLVNSAGLQLSYWDGDAGPHSNSIVNGGNGTWRAAGDQNWTDASGTFAAPFANASFAIFQGAAGTVTVDNTNGQVQAAGMQFATGGYLVQGGDIGLVGPQSTIRVGDGTAAGASYVATITSNLIGASQLVKTDLGTLVLSGTNSYSGGTAINSGTLQVGSNGSLGAASGGLSLNGGTLHTTDTFTSARAVTLNAAGGTFDTDSATKLTLTNTVSGAGALTKAGAGTLVLASDATHSGGTTITAGTLQVGNGGTAGSLAGNVSDNGTLAFDRSDTLSFGGVISGTGNLNQIGTGTTILTGDSTYSGGTTIAAGTLQLGNDGTSGSILGDVVDNGTLAFDRSDAVTFGGTISGSGGIRQFGSGSTTLTANNSYTGATVVDGGTLFVNGDQSAATGPTSVDAGGTLGGTGTIGGDVSVADGGSINPGAAGAAGTLTINGALGLSGGSSLNYDFGQANVVGGALNDLTVVAGNLTLDGTINVAVAPGGTFSPGIYRVISYGGTLTDNGLDVGTIPSPDFFVQTSVANQVNLVNTAGLLLNFWDGDAGPKNDGAVNGGNGTWQNSAGNDDWTEATGAINAPYQDNAFAIFAGAAGTVTVDNGLGQVSAAGMQFATDGYLIQGDDIALVGPQSTIRVGDGTAASATFVATIASNLTGGTQLVKDDLGTLVLSGTNSYSGGTAVNGGTVRISQDANLGAAAGGLSFDGGTLNTTADVTSARAVTLAGAGTFLTDAATTTTLSGGITGAGALTKDGTGTLVLTSNAAHTGGTTIAAGTLQVGNGGALGSLAGNVVDNGTLAFDRSDAITFGGVISGTGGLNQIGTGTTILTAANSYGGQTNVNSGTLLVNGNQAGATGLTAVAGGATLGGTGIIGGDVTMADGSTLSPGGSGNSAGALTINGNLTLSGGTSLAYNFGQANAPGGALNDVVNVGGNLTLDGTLNITATAGGSFGPGVYRVFNYNGSLIDNGLALTSPDYSVQTSIANQVNLINTAGQLLTFWDGDAGPKNNSVVDGGNGTWQVAGSGDNWTTPGGEVNAPWSNGQFAVFQGTPGTVSVDNGNGPVTVNGMQFAADGYRIQGDAITLTGGPAIINVGDGTSDSAGYKATIASDLVGNAGLTKVDYGTLILAGNSSYVGATTVQDGTLAAGKAGAFNTTSAFTVASGGTLDLAGFDQTVASLNNSGAVRLGAAAPGTVLTVSGDYVGNGGKILINAALDGDASATDRLVVHGNTSGTGILAVSNVGGAGAQTSEGIKIVDIDGSSAGTFTLAGDYVFEGDQAVVGGAYAYRLYKNGVSTPADGDWYLRSTLINQTGPLYAPSTPLYEAYEGVLQSFNELGTLQQRIGNRAWGEGATPQGADVPGQGPVDGNAIWARIDAAHGKFEPKTSTTGTDYDVTTWKLNAGVDGLLHESEAGILLGGITVHYGTVSSDVSSTFGTGSISATGYGVGGTLTWLGNSGFYVDSQAQATWYDSDINSAVLGKLADGNKGFGYALSIESGQKIALRSNWSLTPQAQLSYSAVDFDTFTDRFGAIVSPGSGDSLIGRLGISADYEDQWADSAGQVSRAHIYGIANIYYDFLDGTDVDVSGVKLSSQNQKFWGGVGLGGSLDFGDGKYSVYGEALAKTSLASFGDSNVISGKLGFSVRW
ncbi:autotransporter-associated beta strand repeat-containing protein [Mesorhizobium sp. CA4]|uniref:autotransporter-associated beta strand repeat-containing protein n=1 Tax=Mesorhizobium sp. CA4 TaxID=588499 RepID=UPI001CD13805|nr:autotransporter-associated beta strand repeat-containing protein [Mesorhizobium sp. CA4]MBZ9822831.1 autotransporter outer membrane beta-barrel domain-containing protein [Mesorhizobium sp. CA4]